MDMGSKEVPLNPASDDAAPPRLEDLTLNPVQALAKD